MHSEFFGRSPVRRIVQDLDRRFNITLFGANNLYPQEMHQIMLRSPLVKSAVGVLGDFINGDGFENGDVIVNDRAMTINDILGFASLDFAQYDGFALLLSMNGLGTVESIENIPFEFVRFGLPDQLGRHTAVKISNNWDEQPNELPQGSSIVPLEFPIFNPATAQENALSGAGNQVLYFTGSNRDEYPLVSFDAITNTADSDANIQQFELNSIANGFHGLTLFKYYGQFASEAERQRLHNKIKQAQGVGGNGIFLIEVDEDTPTMLENIAANNTDSLYLNTIAHLVDTVTINYAIPSVLLGVSNSGSVFNEQALIDSFIIYNAKTRNRRNIMERAFNALGDFGKIIPQSIGEEEEEVVEEEVVEEETTEEEEDQAEAVIKSLTA